MLTPAVDGDVAGLWVSFSELGRMRNVSKQAITKRIQRLEALGALTTKPGERGAKLVNVAEFDRAVGDTTDAVRAQNGAAAGAEPPADGGVLSQQQARKARYAADLARLDLEERLGKLLPVGDVEAAMTRCAEAMVRAIGQMSSRADDCAAAVARDGVHGARTFLRGLERELRARIGQEMRLIEAAGNAEHAASREAEEPEAA